jgi:hypothetical protein
MKDEEKMRDVHHGNPSMDVDFPSPFINSPLSITSESTLFFA